MKEVFIHRYFFRVISAVVGGFLAYLLILLLNNNLWQLQEYNFGSELYLCIGLAFVLLELLRQTFLWIDRKTELSFNQSGIITKLIISSGLCILVVTFTLKIYYVKVIGFSPSLGELVELNSIFLGLCFLYLLVYLSSHFLYTVSNEKLTSEKIRKEELEEDFRQFRQGINPNLLFESLEALLVAIDRDSDEADALIDYLAVIYRYLLSAKNKQLVPFAEEKEKVKELVKLINHLPYRKITLNVAEDIDTQVIPGALMMVIQQIVRTTILRRQQPLLISIVEENDSIVVSHERFDKLSKRGLPDSLKEVKRTFKVLSDKEITEILTDKLRSIVIPKLILNQ